MVCVYGHSNFMCLRTQQWFVFTDSAMVCVYGHSNGVCLRTQQWCEFTDTVIVCVYGHSNGMCLRTQQWCVFTDTAMVCVYGHSSCLMTQPNIIQLMCLQKDAKLSFFIQKTRSSSVSFFGLMGAGRSRGI